MMYHDTFLYCTVTSVLSERLLIFAPLMHLPNANVVNAMGL